MKRLMLGLMIWAGASTSLAGAQLSKDDVMGVWRLTKFFITDGSENAIEWCGGATGTIAYLPETMFVAINCESYVPGSGAEKLGGKLFYSGHFNFDNGTQEVIHRVRNYSHPSLNKVYRRSVEMKDSNSLRLVGELGEGKQAIVEWERIESFDYDNQHITGVWELVGSENEAEGLGDKVSFCTGFYGTFIFTPGGYAAVSINCGEKADPKVIEPADQFGRRFFYSGSYEAKSGKLTVIPENASEDYLIGETAVRVMNLDKDILMLTGTNGSKFVAKWRKARSFVGL